MPSKTWTRERVPSMTRKCTRTGSPALNCGTSRSCRCSSCSMTLLMEAARTAGRGMLAEPDAIRRPVHPEYLADQVLARHHLVADRPLARVARRGAVVAHEEVRAGRDL